MGNILDCCKKQNNEVNSNIIEYRTSPINKEICTQHPWMADSPSKGIIMSSIKSETEMNNLNLNDNKIQDAMVNEIVATNLIRSPEKIIHDSKKISDSKNSTASQTNYYEPNIIEAENEKLVEDYIPIPPTKKEIEIKKEENKVKFMNEEHSNSFIPFNDKKVLQEEIKSVVPCDIIDIPKFGKFTQNEEKHKLKIEEIKDEVKNERRFSKRQQRLSTIQIVDTQEKTNIDSSNVNNNKIQLYFDLTNEIEEYEDCEYELEFYLEKSKNDYELIEKSQTAQKGKNFRFSLSPILTYFFEKNQNLKCFIKSSYGKDIIIKTNFGKLISSQEQGNLIEINKDKLSQSNKIEIDYNLNHKKNQKDTKDNFYLRISYNYVETKNENIFSSLGVTLKLNLPIFPEKEIKFKFKKNGTEIYTSEYKKSNKFFEYLNLFLNKTKFAQDCIDYSNTSYSIEFYHYNNILFALSNDIKYKNLIKSPDIQIKQSGQQNNKIIGIAKLIYAEKPESPFLWYLSNGLKISLIVAIDYTSSNLEYTNPNSLHHLSKDKQNLYEKAIIKCGSIVSYFDKDQMFPLYGFGGIPPHSHDVSHCFNVNFTNDPEVEGIENMVATYRNNLKYVKLHGPTYFSHIIKKVLDNSRKIQDRNNNYCVIMILTDGLIDDMRDTIDVIVEASSQPVSVIIIGVGSSDFSNMIILGNPLTNSKGEHNVRNIVQFVTLNEFENDIEKLSEKVFSSLPKQIEDYFKIRNFNKLNS